LPETAFSAKIPLAERVCAPPQRALAQRSFFRSEPSEAVLTGFFPAISERNKRRLNSAL